MRIRAEILRELSFYAGHYPSLEGLCDRFDCSARTLKRELAKEGWTFREIVDGVRQDLAVQFLCFTDLPVKEIAFRVGYTNVNNFRRAFRRWTASTAAAFRTERAARALN